MFALTELSMHVSVLSLSLVFSFDLCFFAAQTMQEENAPTSEDFYKELGRHQELLVITIDQFYEKGS